MSDECLPLAPCRRDRCVFCDPAGYLDARDDASILLDGPRRPGRADRPAVELDAETDRRQARIRSLTYRRSELDQIPAPGWLIEGMINRSSLTMLSGKFGTYKSFVSVALACSVATGVPFLGMRVVEPGPVIYVAAEGASGLRARIRAWELEHLAGGYIPDDKLIVIGGAVRILNPAEIAALREVAKDVRAPKLTIWDTLHRCAPGADEDGSREAGLVIDVLSELREDHDCTQLINHHTGHSGVRARGSSSWEDDCDGSWVIRLDGDGEDRSPTNQRTLEHRKIKDGELSGKIPIGLSVAGESAYVERKQVQPDANGLRSWLVVKAYAQQLDRAGVPLSYGRPRIQKALKALGVEKVGNDMATEISRLRHSASYQPAPPEASQDVLETS